MFRVRKWRRSALALLASATLVGLAGSASAATFHWLTARGEREPTAQAIWAVAQKYKATHRDFDLQVEYAADRPSYLQKIKILATSGQLPDLFDADAEPYFADIVANGLVANVGKIFDELGITNKFYKFALDYERLDDGGLYLIPFQSNVEYFWYHPSLFKKAGVEVPKTLSELHDMCAKLKAANIPPISVEAKDGWPIYRYLSLPAFRETGNKFLDELKVGKVSMNSPVGLDSSRYLQAMGQDCFQEGFATADYTTALNLFTSGQAAIYYIGTWELPSMLDDKGNLKDDVAYFKMPMVEGENATKPTDFYAHSGIGTAISAKADTPELRDFIKYLSDTLGDTMLYDFKVLPSLKPTIKPDLPQTYKDLFNDIDNVDTYAKVWDVKLDANTVDVLFRQSQLLALGKITPEEFGTAIDKSIAQYVAGK